MRSLSVAAVVALSVSLHAQTPEKRSFEVVSVKRNPEGKPFGGLTFSPGGRFVGENVSVYTLIVQAFGGGRPLPPARIAATPEWVRFDQFNIVARAGSDAPTDELALSQVRPGYLRGLLEDRASSSNITGRHDSCMFTTWCWGDGTGSSDHSCSVARPIAPQTCRAMSASVGRAA